MTLPDNQEFCPVCNYCKMKDDLCLKCKRYINQERTPTKTCEVCGNEQPSDNRCFHEHYNVDFKGTQRVLTRKNQEECPICNCIKKIDKVCIKCLSYINEDTTPTEKCNRCGKAKPINGRCQYSHTNLVNDCKIIAMSIEPAKHPNSLVFYVPGSENEEALRINKEGFWVRGVKVEQGETEAKEVYTAFCKLLGYNNGNN